VRGLGDGAGQWGLARPTSRWAHINGYLYFGRRDGGSIADEELAERARRERWWVDESRRWFEEERPAVVAANRALQQVDVAGLDDRQLVAHVEAALAHLLAVGPLHFEHRGREVVMGLLRPRAESEGLDRATVDALLAGGSPATSRPARMVEAIGDALRDAGADAAAVRSLDDVRSHPGAAAALDEYLEEFAHRLLDSYDLACPTLGERPEVVVASIRAAAAARPSPPAPSRPPMSQELAQLLDEARVAYGLEDDDDGVCLFWPSGLLRRALLELARRRNLSDASHVFEVDVDELRAMLQEQGPSATTLAARARAREGAESVVPPAVIGAREPPPSPGDDQAPAERVLRGQGIGSDVARGRACVVGLGGDGLIAIEPGDVLIATTTTPGYNVVMPIVAAVATETTMGHTVIAARELGIPAVIGVAGLLAAIPHGAMVEVDAAAGTVRVLD
jgi:pyruvate,water dikinase